MDNQQSGVYDKEKEKPITSSGLNDAEKKGLDSQSSASESLADKETSAGKGLKSAATGVAKTAGASASGGGAVNVAKKALNVLKNNKKKAAYGGGAIGGIIALIVAIFLMLIPLKIEHMVKNLENHFFATSQDALGNETDKLFRSYVINKVLPGYKGVCGSTIDKNCSAKSSVGDGPVSKLFNTWRDNKLENKLANKYGVEFKIDAEGGLQLKTPGNSIVDLGHEGIKFDSVFQSTDKASIRQAVRDAVANETRYKKVYLRFQAGRLLEKKYGVRRCLFYCKISDPVFDKIKDQKLAAKLFLVNRVISPRSEILGGATSCIIDPKCDPSKPEPTSPTDSNNPSNSDGENGRATSGLEKENTKTLDTIFEKLGFASAEDLAKEVDRINKAGGFTKDIVTKLVEKVAGTAAGEAAGKAVPVIGQINMVAEIVTAGKNIGPKIKAIGYMVNAATAVSMWGTYSSLADEIHTGHVKAAEVGGFTSQLGPADSTQTDPNNPDKLIGGKAGAEQTPLYSNLMGSGATNNGQSSSASTSFIQKLIPSVFASSNTSGNTDSTYKCNNGSSVPNGQLVCPEEGFTQGNAVANDISNVINGIPGLTTLADIWNNTIGFVINGAQSILGLITGFLKAGGDQLCKVQPFSDVIPGVGFYCGAMSFVNDNLPKLLEAIVSYLIPQTVGPNMSGGRTFDTMAAGADVAGNDNAHSTLGGQKLTNQQTADIMKSQYNQQVEEFNKLPIMAKIFSRDTPMSLVSTIAMKVPLNSFGIEIQNIVISYISNPVNKIMGSFSLIMNPHKVFAAPVFQGDPFGITQYGYPAGSIPDDPETYWNNNCSDNESQAYQKDNSWNDSAVNNVDSDTEQGVNNTVNPCLLIKATVGATGAVYDTGLLTPSQQTNIGGGQ